MSSKRGTVAPVAMLLLGATLGEAGDPAPLPAAEAERRAEIGRSGRLVFCDLKGTIAFCDLDGGNVLETSAGPATYVKWLADGVRVLASARGKVLIVDSVTGDFADLAPDSPGDSFAAAAPRISPDGRYALYWRKRVTGKYKQLLPVAYTVFDLDQGTHVDVGPVEAGGSITSWASGMPTAWWSPQGELYAGVSATTKEGESAGSRWNLVRWSPRTGTTAVVAELPWGTRVTEMAFLGERFAYGVAPEQANHFVPQVMSEKGEHLYELVSRGMIWGIRFDPDGSALRLRIQAADGANTTKFWRVESGKDAVEIPEFDPPRRTATGVPGVEIEERWKKDDPEASGLFRVATATGEATRIGPGSGAKLVGDVVVFWRVTVPSKQAEGPYFEHPKTIPGTDDLWAFDPKDGAVIRLTDRGFQARCWDFRVGAPKTPPK